MGMEQTITFPAGAPPSWAAARDLLASRGIRFQMRMIDGELAFPDEEPREDRRELRIATLEGKMVTVQRERDRVVLMVWGNADAGLVQTWNALTWAFAEAGNGQVHTVDGVLKPPEYAGSVELPAALRTHIRSSK